MASAGSNQPRSNISQLSCGELSNLLTWNFWYRAAASGTTPASWYRFSELPRPKVMFGMEMPTCVQHTDSAVQASRQQSSVL
ncbi:hypothetical protein ZHAS_00010976 [Anopheles sinensis]|uniref:Uncharacterized protein n=1 Tax=Anopheles sinensis TaxID=74873 RepID=A0A084VZ05_ANOSI|nr:hypothetical protein ZHAS_00010976 [Anopheles sinensis]